MCLVWFSDDPGACLDRLVTVYNKHQLFFQLFKSKTTSRTKRKQNFVTVNKGKMYNKP